MFLRSQTRICVRGNSVQAAKLAGSYGIWYARNELVKTPRQQEVLKTPTT
jgi:hypothetical protein